MPTTRQRRRSKPPGRRRALELLAGAGPAGCSADVLAAHGYSATDLLALVREGLATPNAAHHRAGPRGVGEGDTINDSAVVNCASTGVSSERGRLWGYAEN